jgi:hypothetical protein
MGYGRINVARSMRRHLIKDWPGDTGIEPSSPPNGDFWDFSDIVVRITDDNVFVPRSEPVSNVGAGRPITCTFG